MRWRTSSTVWIVGSVLVLAALVAALYFDSPPKPDLVVYAAVSLRTPMESAAVDYQRRTGRRVELHFGASENILNQVRLTSQTHPADLFIPADDSYIRKAESSGLTSRTLFLARMRAVILCGSGNPKRIGNWNDLMSPGVRLALAEPDAAAIGLLTRTHLQAQGQWDAFERQLVVRTGNVTESANAVKLGTVDAAVVWDAVAAHYPQQVTIRLPELDGIVAQVRIATLTSSRDPEAAQEFASYLATTDSGRSHFRAAGFDMSAPAGGAP